MKTNPTGPTLESIVIDSSGVPRDANAPDRLETRDDARKVAPVTRPRRGVAPVASARAIARQTLEDQRDAARAARAAIGERLARARET